MALTYNGTRYGLNATADEGQWQQITRSDAMDAWRQIVKAQANIDIAWAWNNFPFAEWDIGNSEFLNPVDNYGADPIGGIPDQLSEATFGSGGSIITSNIAGIIIEHTRRYLKIRKITAKLNVTGDGGNTGSRPTPGIVFDETKKAVLNPAYQLAIDAVQYGENDALVGVVPFGPVNTTGMYSGNEVNNLDTIKLMFRLQLKYNAARDTVAFVRQVDVCHASCHSSCHGSRGRR